MKSLVKAFGFIAFLIISFQANAVSLGSLSPDDNLPISNAVFGSGFADTYGFKLTETSTLGISATNVYFGSSNKITNFGGELISSSGSTILDLTKTPISASGVVQVLSLGLSNLSAGNYVLKLFGDAPLAGASYGGNIVVSAVPVPTAFWLMGSALVGLVGIKRRKNAVAV